MLNVIKSLLHKDYHVSKTNNVFSLDETGLEASCKEARFEAKNEYLVYKFDKKGKKANRLFPFFNDGNANAICDYIIFYKKSNYRLFAVICNLKSKQKSNNWDQLQSGKIFCKFIYDTARRINPQDFEGVSIEFVNVLFSTIRLYTNRKESSVINLLSNEEVKETFIFENKCR